MKTKRVIYLLAISIACLAMGCSVYTTAYSSTADGTDFSKYHTFAWLPDQTDTTDLPYNNEIIRNNIRNCFGKNLAERGYTVDLNNPDLLLGIVVTNKKKERIRYSAYPQTSYYCRYYYGSTYYIPYEFNYYYRNFPVYCYPIDYYTQKFEYIEGSITLNVLDRSQNKLIWSGTAKGDIYDPAYINKNIHPAIRAIMKKYPVKPIIKKK